MEISLMQKMYVFLLVNQNRRYIRAVKFKFSGLGDLTQTCVQIKKKEKVLQTGLAQHFLRMLFKWGGGIYFLETNVWIQVYFAPTKSRCDYRTLENTQQTTKIYFGKAIGLEVNLIRFNQARFPDFP